MLPMVIFLGNPDLDYNVSTFTRKDRVPPLWQSLNLQPFPGFTKIGFIISFMM